MNDSNYNEFKKFCLEHKGAIIGGLIAVIIAFTALRQILFGCIIIIGGIWLGNYVQKNKDYVKEKLKNLIDKF
jgi:uncharacterized membrane protein